MNCYYIYCYYILPYIIFKKNNDININYFSKNSLRKLNVGICRTYSRYLLNRYNINIEYIYTDYILLTIPNRFLQRF